LASCGSQPIRELFLQDTEERAKTEFGEIMKNNELWVYMSDMVMEDYFTRLFRICYGNVSDRYE
jgi:hypothetical protein